MSWNTNEKEMFSTITSHNLLKDLTQTTNQYAKYDAENSQFIVELKHRPGKQWPDTLIEKAKYDALMKEAAESNRTPLYVVWSAGKTYIFNLLRLTDEGFDFGWHQRKCKTTTHFSNNNYTPKEVGMITWDQAKVVL